MVESEILCERRGNAGVVILHRPAALNALTLNMVRGMRQALDAWADDPDVTRVVVTGAGERAFCAGGDIRALYEAGRAGRQEEALAFWREEYELNILIKRYPKPYVALVDGIVMGGGVGVSLHGSHRVAGDRYLFAMPEVGIGFFPDVGATYALPRLPDHIGTYLALTGERIRRPDAVALGLATHAIPTAEFPALIEDLTGDTAVDDAIGARLVEPGQPPLLAEREVIAQCFSAPDVGAILERLDTSARNGSEFAAKTAATMRTKSPTSLRIAHAQMLQGRSLDFEEAMKVEFRIVSRILDGRDFYEGVRATIIEKDGQPRWQPAALADVDDEAVGGYFAGLGPDELKVPG